jgi:hypothetical protein
VGKGGYDLTPKCLFFILPDSFENLPLLSGLITMLDLHCLYIFFIGVVSLTAGKMIPVLARSMERTNNLSINLQFVENRAL